jgi:hypothetical protein
LYAALLSNRERGAVLADAFMTVNTKSGVAFRGSSEGIKE